MKTGGALPIPIAVSAPIAIRLWLAAWRFWVGALAVLRAEAAMLGQPISMLVPDVIGLRLQGALCEGVTATDLVLRVTELLREKGVVGKFV